MDNREIIQAILKGRPEVAEPEVLAALEAERTKTAGLIADATLLRLIAATYGVEIQRKTTSDPKLLISHLVPNLNRITISGRVVAVFPVKTFEGEKPGKYASLLIADKNSILRVILWNGKADLVESGAVKVGQVAKFLRGYTKQDLNGKTELHVGEKGDVEAKPLNLCEDDYPSIEQFLVPVRDVSLSNQNVHVAGRIKAVFPMSTFTRQDNSTGKVLRFFVSDETGDVMAVAWNEKAEKLEQTLRGDVEVKLVNARVKTSSGGGLEVHIDEATYVEVSTSSGRNNLISNP
jgi:ssDNA-binding replication factor A large subunit